MNSPPLFYLGLSNIYTQTSQFGFHFKRGAGNSLRAGNSPPPAWHSPIPTETAPWGSVPRDSYCTGAESKLPSLYFH